ncbi:MAG: HDIG domain-containing protein [Sedimentisphaerales bacterium]|nr:HDIG domain-containing protein [Sedimentisphaerales bacterium]
MYKRKSKRVDVRPAMEGQQAARRERFYASGAPLSLAMLGLFILASSLLMICQGRQTFGQLWQGHWPVYRSLLLMLGLMGVLSTALALYISAFQPRIIKNHLRGGVLLATLFILIVLIQIGGMYHWSAYLIVVPVLVLAIMMTIAYSQRVALGIGSFLLLIGVLLVYGHPAQSEHAMAVLLSAGSAMGIAILGLKEIRTRTKVIAVCGQAALIAGVMIWLVGLWRHFEYDQILRHSLAAAGGSLAAGFVMQGLLPFIERLFRTATSLTLLDWSEANKPLLRRLAVEAPGTFNHSLQIGMLTEAAAEAIGVNGLLCRVGSYYHDVGKLSKSRYFVENQAERINQHKELSPTMSRMIIIGHVKDGLELAKEYKLPRILHQFISSHHGTTVVEYFFHEAAKREAESGRTITETDFRYPGPKPTSKEAAIVMLADAVESATRSVQDPTPNRIENVVHNVGMRRLQDGQFDNCDLTMRELRLIENSLIKSLCAMYHSRIAYPKRDKEEKYLAEPVH